MGEGFRGALTSLGVSQLYLLEVASGWRAGLSRVLCSGQCYEVVASVQRVPDGQTYRSGGGAVTTTTTTHPISSAHSHSHLAPSSCSCGSSRTSAPSSSGPLQHRGQYAAKAMRRGKRKGRTYGSRYICTASSLSPSWRGSKDYLPEADTACPRSACLLVLLIRTPSCRVF